jgi:hypothetical protein
MRTFLDMAREAYTVRCEVFAKGGGEREVGEIEFPMSKPEMRAAGKRPWTAETADDYGNRMYGLKCVLID